MSQPSASTGERFSRTRPESTHEEIARHARRLWEQYGRPAGRDEQIWLEAERQLRGLELTPHRVAEQLALTGRRAVGHTVAAHGSRVAHANGGYAAPATDGQTATVRGHVSADLALCGPHGFPICRGVA